MLSRSGIILFYFSKWSYQIVNELVVKGTPRVGQPAKEGLRHRMQVQIKKEQQPRVGHPAKEGLRHYSLFITLLKIKPRVGHPAKEGLRRDTYIIRISMTWSQSRSSSKRGIKT